MLVSVCLYNTAQLLVDYRYYVLRRIQKVVEEALSKRSCVLIVLYDLECLMKTSANAIPNLLIFLL